MNYLKCLLFLSILANQVAAQNYTYTAEGFESSPWTVPSTIYSVSTGTWTTSATTVVGSPTTPRTGIMCLSIPTSQFVSSPTLNAGAGTLIFYARSNSTTARMITISISTDGTTYSPYTTASSAASSLSYALVSVVINNLQVRNIRITFSGSGAIDDLIISSTPVPAFYNAPNSDLSNTASWFSGSDGASGVHPANFTTGGQSFNITHTGGVMLSGWTVSGAGSKVITGDGIMPISFTIPSGFAITGTIDVTTNATLYISNVTNPTLGNIGIGSSIVYNAPGTQTVLLASYSNLMLSGSRSGSAITLPAGLISVSGVYQNAVTNANYVLSGNTIDFSSTSAQTISEGSYNNITNTGNAARTLSSNGAIRIAGTLSPGTGNYTVTGSDVQFVASSASFTLNLPVVANGHCFDKLTINGSGSIFTVPFTNSIVDLAALLTIQLGTLKLNNSNSVSNIILIGSLVLSGLLNIDRSTLTFNGSVTGNGTISGSNLSNLSINGNAGTLNFTPGGQVLKDLTLNANATATLGSSLNISGGLLPGTITIGAGATLNSGGNLTLRSDANGTARVGQSTGIITGNVNIERYIPANTTRAWRLLSVPVTTNQTFHSAWQENQAAGIVGVNNLGVILTSSRATWNSDGFDYASIGDAFLSWNGSLNNLSGGWVGITSTNSAMTTDNGYMVYIRGDRNATPMNTNITPTTLRATGNLKQGPYPLVPITIPASQFELIGNPYNSQINFASISKSIGIDNTFYVWDPKLYGSNGLGGFQSMTFDGTNYVISPGSGSYGPGGSAMTTIESGQGFFVHASSISSLSFTENAKTNGNVMVFNPTTISEKLVTNLYTIRNSISLLSDGTLSLFDNGFSNNITPEDALKLSNFGLTFSIARETRMVAIEKRKLILISDTIMYSMNNAPIGDYQMELIATNLNHPSLYGFLEDSYLGSRTSINLNGNTMIGFSVNADTLSSLPHRFRMIFTPVATLPITFLTIEAYTQNKNIKVQWSVAANKNTRFDIERSADGSQFISIGKITDAHGNYYSFTDNQPVSGDNFYRIKSTELNGEINYSRIVRVLFHMDGDIRVIAKGSRLVLRFYSMPPGEYKVNLYDEIGRQLFTGSISHPGGSCEVELPKMQLYPVGQYRINWKR